MSHSSRKSGPPPSGKQAAEVLTYRYDNDLVYVTPTDSYSQAVKYAQREFPSLRGVNPERIVFQVTVPVSGTPRPVRIASMAWSKVIGSLAPYEVLDITVQPEYNISRAAKSDTDLTESAHFEAPPRYNTSQVMEQKEEKSGLSDFLTPPPDPIRKRSTSAMGWLGKHNR